MFVKDALSSESFLCVLQAARAAAQRAERESGSSVPSYPGLRRRVPSSGRLMEQGMLSTNSPAALEHGRDESPGRAQMPPGTRSLPCLAIGNAEHLTIWVLHFTLCTSYKRSRGSALCLACSNLGKLSEGMFRQHAPPCSLAM